MNDSTLADGLGEYDPWVEIWNGHSTNVELGGVHLTDSSDIPFRWSLPDTTLPPGGIFSFGQTEIPLLVGAVACALPLNGSGGYTGPFINWRAGDPRFAFDTVTYGPQQSDVSYARQPDGGDWTKIPRRLQGCLTIEARPARLALRPHDRPLV